MYKTVCLLEPYVKLDECWVRFDWAGGGLPLLEHVELMPLFER